MKKVFRKINLLVCSLLVITALQAQDLPFPVEKVGGQEVYMYPVKKGEGVFRICKNFNITQEELMRYNPELQQSGLREGQIIKVPVKETIDSTRYVLHEVQPKETVYRLRKQYKVSTAQLEELNPQLKTRGPQIGETLLIKLKEVVETVTETATKVIPEVAQEPESQPQDILIGKLQDILQRMDSMKNVIAPVVDTIVVTIDSTLPSIMPVVDSIIPSVPIPAVQTPDTLVNTEPIEGPIRIAYLLPFMTEMAKRDASADRFLEFYEGALLAIYEEQQRGQKFEIYAYDTEKSESRLSKVLQRPEMQNMDLIIGPAYPSQVVLMSKFCFENHIPALIPFTSKVTDLRKNPYLLQFNATTQREVRAITDYLSQQADSVNLILSDINAEDNSSDIQALFKAIALSSLSYKNLNYNQLTDSLAQYLQDDKLNIILLNQEKYAAAEPLLQAISRQQGNNRIKLMSQYSWLNQEMNIPSFYTSVFNDSKTLQANRISYSLKFGYFFRHEVQNHQPRYDLLGYDITHWVVRMMQQDGALPLRERVIGTEYRGLQSDLQFEATTNKGGYESVKVQVIER